MSTTGSLRAQAVDIRAFIARRSGALRGFAEVGLLSGMILHDTAIYVDGDRAWAMPASKPMLDRNGVAMRDDKGKIRYSPVITFATKELRDKFSRAVIEAMRRTHPDALIGGPA